MDLNFQRTDNPTEQHQLNDCKDESQDVNYSSLFSVPWVIHLTQHLRKISKHQECTSSMDSRQGTKGVSWWSKLSGLLVSLPYLNCPSNILTHPYTYTPDNAKCYNSFETCSWIIPKYNSIFWSSRDSQIGPSGAWQLHSSLHTKSHY